jgi:predicted RNA-binding protein with PUA-like domain
MSYWLLKTEPGEYSFDDLKSKGAGGDAWTGVRNFTARTHMRAMQKGDRAFIYHTGDEKQVVGIAEVLREAYPDPTDDKGAFLAIDLKATEALPKPVTLATVKAEKQLAGMALVKYGRLSVQPVSDAEWKAVRRLGGLKA